MQITELRDELRDVMYYAMRETLHADTLYKKCRIIKFAFTWFRSIFRPFINREELS